MNTVLAVSVLAVVIVAITLYCLFQVLTLRRRLSGVLANQSGDSIEEALTTHFKRVKSAEKNLEELKKAYKMLAESSSLASQKISIVRFNPFADTGGDQSFVLAVLDAHNSGYVLTSIHGREGTRVYVKPVDYGKSKYQLSVEEKQALSQAAKRTPS